MIGRGYKARIAPKYKAELRNSQGGVASWRFVVDALWVGPDALEMNATNENPLRIWVDADACPVALKEILFRTARRREVRLVLVANQSMPIPRSDLIELLTVPYGANVADDRIVELVGAGDIVVTADIPLAARVVEKQAVAIGTRGELYDENNVHDRLASRDLMEQFRAAGVETSGPKPLNQKDVQSFANVLDRMLTQRLKK